MLGFIGKFVIRIVLFDIIFEVIVKVIFLFILKGFLNFVKLFLIFCKDIWMFINFCLRFVIIVFWKMLLIFVFC